MSIKLGLIITLCLILQLSLSMQVKSLAQQGKRNLAAYDKSGPYSFDNEPPWEKRERMAGWAGSEVCRVVMQAGRLHPVRLHPPEVDWQILQ